MKKKQILAVLLAGLCAASMSVSAFAAGDDEITMAPAATKADYTDAEQLANWTMGVETEVQPASLKVTLPTTTTVLVNPYRMEVKINDTDTSYDTVLSPEMEIINNSKCAIKVGVKGMIETYTKLDVTDSTVWKGLDTIDSDCALTANATLVNPDGGAAVEIDGTSDILTDGKQYATSDGYALTVKYTKSTYKTDSSLNKAGTVTVSGYVASKNIKLATAAMKDPDTEKGNSIYMFVEGTLTSGNYAAFTKASNAGVKDTKTGTISTVGQLVLSAKEATGTVLYLKSGETGYTRVSGQAATAPTNSWASLKDKFNTSLTYVIDAVANPAPTAPVLQKIKFTGIAPTGGAAADDITIAGAATTGLTWDAGNEGANSTITATTDKGVLAPSSITSSDTSVININSGKLKALDNGTATITMVFTDKGVSSTYTFDITVSGL